MQADDSQEAVRYAMGETPSLGSRTGRERVETELRRLGLLDDEARVYSGLLSGPRSPDELARNLDWPASDLEHLLSRLTARGLVNRLPGPVDRFTASPPEWVFPAMLRQREEEIERLRDFSRELEAYHRSLKDPGRPREYVEVVVGAEPMLAQAYEQLGQAESEIIHFVKGPILRIDNPGADQSLARGVRYRSIWDRDVLEEPGIMDAARASAEAGEEVRAIDSLPSKLVIVDQKLAIISVTESVEGEDRVAGLTTRHPELVATLVRLAELLWQGAVPLFSDGPAARSRGDEQEKLLACLSAGMADSAIARELGVSQRTLARRIQGLLDELGVGTRYQLALKIAARHP